MLEALQKKMAREESILLSLKKLDYLSRSQLQRLHDLGGTRNARRIMENLSPFVSTLRGTKGENIFYLNKSGRERVGCDVVRQRIAQAGHYIMRADAYIHYKGAEDWKNEVKFSVEGIVSVVPDAYFRYQQKRHFLEVDHLQSMVKNREKVERYRKLLETGVFQQKLKYFPRLVWVTLTPSRKEQLAEICKGLDTVIHLWDEIK